MNTPGNPATSAQLHSAIAELQQEVQHLQQDQQAREAAYSKLKSEYKQLEAQLHLANQQGHIVGEIALRIRQSLDLEQILNTTVVEVQQFLEADRVCLCFITDDWQTKIVAESVLPDWHSLLGTTITDVTFSQEMLARFEAGILAISDISELGLSDSASQLLLERCQIKASLGVPIKVDQPFQATPLPAYSTRSSSTYDGDRGFWILMADQCSETREWQPFEIELLEQLGNQVAIAIQQAKLFQQLAALNANLEQEVESRTAELRCSNALLKAQQEAALDGILVVDENRSIVSYNQRFCQLWRIPELAMQNQHSGQLIELVIDKVEQPEVFRAQIDYLYQHIEEITYDEILLKDGRTLERYSIAARSPQGHYYGRVFYFRDISEAKREEVVRKQTEAALRESEERLRTLINATPDIICFKDGEGRWLESNQANLDFFELKELEYKGKTDAELAQFSHSYGDILSTCHLTDQEAWQLQAIQRIEEICLRADGTVKILDLIKVPLFDPDGERKGLVVLGRDISELKRAEAALRASELQYRDLVQTANCIILRWDTNGDILFMNDYGQRLLGFESHEIIGRNVVGTIVPETETSGRDLQALMVDICLHPENYLLNENENLCKNGDRVWIVWANKPILDDQGNLVEILSVGTNATQRKQVEAALEESELKFRTIVENAHDTLYVINPEGIFSYLSPNLRNIMGFEPSELLGDSFAPFIHPEDLSRCASAIAHVVATGEKNSEIEYRARCKDGSYSWLVSNLAASRDANGQLIIIGVARDINERKRVEEALQQSELKFRTIVENANDIIFLHDLDGRLTYVSPNISSILGHSVSEMEGRYTAEFIHPDDLSKPIELVRRVVELREKQSGDEVRFRHKDGSWHWFTANISPIEDSNGQITILGIAHDVTERKQAEEALRESEVKYRNIFENSQVGIGRARLEVGGILEANQRCAEMLGYASVAEVIGTPLSPEFVYVNPDDSQRIADIVQQYGEVKNFELELRQRSGTIIWVLLSFRLNPAENYLDFVMEDITDRKQREEALRLIVEGTAAKTGDEFFQSCVRYLAEVLQVRYAFVSRFINATKTKACTLAVWGDSKIDENFEYNTENLPCGQVIKGQVCYYSEDLPTLFPSISDFTAIAVESYLGIPLVDAAGDILGILGVMDVKPMSPDAGRELIMRIFAARAGAELERKQADEAVQYRAQVESLLSSISRQFIDQDLETAVDFSLQAIAQFFGAERSCIFEYSPDQAIAQIVHEWCASGVLPLTLEVRENPVEMFLRFHRLILSGNVVHIPNLAQLSPEMPERRLFEHESVQSLVAVPMSHADKVVGFLGMDVVHSPKTWSQEELSLLKLVGELIAIGRARHQAEEALRIAKEAAEAANRSKSIFLANMSHELRTPLNAILGFTQLMERDPALTDQQEESLEIINRSGEHLLNLINDVLEMSKIEAGRMTLHPTAFNLHQLLYTLQEMFQIRAEAKQLSLQFELAPDLPPYVLIDEGKLRQVLINLLSNAVKFTDRGEVRLRASIQTENRAAGVSYHLCVAVEDTGSGIAPEEIDSLFQPFVQTTSGTQAREGTGLGLTISRQFVQLMGGELTVSSTIAQGSSFQFWVPLTLAALPVESAQATARGRVLRLAPNQPTYRVLVVDDRPENCKFIEQLLQMVGFETALATNGQEAIAQWQSWQPHLIWMDMRMPVMDGYEATRQIRRLEATAPVRAHRTVIIALTASAFEEQRATILASGCDDLVRKPFREQVIFDKIAAYLGAEYLYEPAKTDAELAKRFAAIGARSTSNSLPRIQNVKCEDLRIMPLAWIAELHTAATRVNANLVLQLLEQIPQNHSRLANSLKDLVKHYRFDLLVELTESLIS
ncbi:MULTISPECIES: PAS domain S-box protein [Trichocoleus]|uniref:histidine kinase n=1 Tax=Trichocoleus desertorum GB2-A4 TaxID=2933944 RepID=A0ABV0JBT6_9CYAN|nr:PAS domain S-box protein [Trichocoleus sp. FACHB-46]MBD1865377.1 PAS domain S-box protein [Trichocoleus sp. FACHB-46]